MKKQRRKYKDGSLYWDCKNAVPGGEHGCSWSESFEPVPGWDARRKDVLIGAKKDGKAESYFVYECPEFEKDGAK